MLFPILAAFAVVWLAASASVPLLVRRSPEAAAVARLVVLAVLASREVCCSAHAWVCEALESMMHVDQHTPPWGVLARMWCAACFGGAMSVWLLVVPGVAVAGAAGVL